jgi:hypothetical protein
MNIVIPDNISTGDLHVLPNGVARAVLEKVMLGKSKSGNSKATFKYTIVEEMDGATEPTVGEAVLETMSLQPQALFSLAAVWKAVTGEKLPQGDYEEKEFESMLNNTLAGSEWNLVLEAQVPRDGSSTEPRTTIIKKTLAKK